jgi:hypothetical protein
MTVRVVIVAVVLLLTGLPLRAVDSIPAPGIGRTFGRVPNAASAIRIAITVWEPLYGKKEIASERPFHAEIRKGIWYVYGSLPAGFLGGVAEAKIRQSDGKVLHIFHGQ